MRMPVPEDNLEFEFLIVIKQHDVYRTYMRCISFNRTETFMKFAKHVNGTLRLHIDDDQNKCPFPVRGVMTCNSMYVKLPKERVYIRMDAWYHEFLKSQMLELLYIFRMLGATNVHLTLENNSEDTGSIGVEAAVADIGGGFGVKSSKVQSHGSLINLEATYDEDDKTFVPYKKLEDFVHDKNVFYLAQNQDWQDIIDQRLSLLVRDLKFTFNISNAIQIDNKFYAKMNRLGLSLDISGSNKERVSVSGTVAFNSKGSLRAT